MRIKITFSLKVDLLGAIIGFVASKQPNNPKFTESKISGP